MDRLQLHYLSCRPPPPRRKKSHYNRGLKPLASKEVSLLDYGAGNVRSVRNAIKKLGYSIKDVSPSNSLHSPNLSSQIQKQSDITSASKLIFPGVGSFGTAMQVLTKKQFVDPLKEYIQVHPSHRLRHSVQVFQTLLRDLPRPPTACRGQHRERRSGRTGSHSR